MNAWKCLLAILVPMSFIIVLALDNILRTRKEILRVLQEIKKNKDGKYGRYDR